MQRQKNQFLAQRICAFFVNNDCDRKKTYDHFKCENIPQQRIRRIIDRFNQRGSSEYCELPGRPRSVSIPTVKRKIEKTLLNNPLRSDNDHASRLNLARSTFRFVKKELGFKTYRQETAPKYSKNQESRCKTGANKIYRKFTKDKVIIMDDETYVPTNVDQIPGKRFYNCKDKSNVDNAVRFKSKEKFFDKFLVWQAIDSLGNVSEPFVTKGTMNADTYRCVIELYLIPFIDKFHDRKNVLFWPDMATCHYAKSVTDYLDSQGIEYVKKSDNTPNLPQARPIEKFWAICKAKIKKLNKNLKTIECFTKHWEKVSDEVAKASGANLMRDLKKKLRLVARNGVFGPLKC